MAEQCFQEECTPMDIDSEYSVIESPINTKDKKRKLMENDDSSQECDSHESERNKMQKTAHD